ncbi:MAG: hypothetical protein ACXVHQ_40665 [Solirubrobacteraceae bacterium]
MQEGVESLFENVCDLEASDQNLRAVLTVAQQALLEMVGLGEELVSLASLRDAALGLAF